MIQLISVTKKYGDEITAVEDISLEIQEGEFVFMVGPSGSGKTTVIKMLIREELPSTGKIFFQDEDITKYKRRDVYQHRRKIGVIFQDFKLIPELNAFENIAFVMEAAGKSDPEINESVPYLLDIVGLADRMHFFPDQLSGGEKQRVAIARAMANNPKLLIADEPTGNLDPDSAWDIVQILSKINNWGTTVLMSTHGSDIVNSLHKRVLRMQGGMLVRDDYKGSYDEVDEFSLRVLNASKDKVAPQPGETIAVNSEELAPAPMQPVATEPTLTQKRAQSKKPTEKKPSEIEEKIKSKTKKKAAKSKKIKFSTKKAAAQKNQDAELEQKILEKIDTPDTKATAASSKQPTEETIDSTNLDDKS